MTDLTTPNKAHNGLNATPLDRFVLSPYFSQDNQYYFCMSPLQPIPVTYISPGRNFNIRSRFNEFITPVCSYCNSSILNQKVELLSSIASIEPTKENTSGGTSINPVEHTKDEEERSPKKKTKKNQGEKIESKENRIIRRRKRKNMDQLKVLYNEYKKDPNWNKDTMAEMARKTGLTEAQIYKWSWDQKKKKIE